MITLYVKDNDSSFLLTDQGFINFCSLVDDRTTHLHLQWGHLENPNGPAAVYHSGVYRTEEEVAFVVNGRSVSEQEHKAHYFRKKFTALLETK